MTIVLMRKKGLKYSMKVTGHVRRPSGAQQNDVCVAVSILTQTLIQTLRNHRERYETYEDKLDNDAYAFVSMDCKKDAEGFVSAVFEQTETGLRMLAEQFPESVRFIEGEEKKAI